jgi:hypothetical protein
MQLAFAGFAAAFCSFCLTARFFDQYVKRKSYWIVLSVLLILVGLEVTDLWDGLMIIMTMR